ncbi:MAG: extracellular solute-binding protein [Treponema sp.]|jgi:ABC-type glycerol-3-phosphate transport system substrate-binding protein|nr:extracellular solute-binding protein [Treponema sp.]
MKMTKWVGLILCALIIVTGMFMLSACGKPSLRGTDIVIGNWWADYDVNSIVPRNDSEERILEWRTKIQKDYGFRMRERNIASWNEMPQVAATSIMTGSPAATVFVLQGNWAMSLITQNLAYPVSESKVIDLRNPEPVDKDLLPPVWNKSSIDAFTFNGKTYAFSEGINMTNAQVIFFNKRLFREAGLDPELPYDMQRDGTWTWDNFLAICKRLTRDINNDGITDTYAMPRDLSTDILDAILSSNGATYVDRDPETGRFVNATNRPEFMEGLQFAIRLNNEGIMRPKPDGVNWDWYKSEFADGTVAMRIDESYVWGELQNMNDDWGVVMFPRGPRSDSYRVYTRENMLVIPATFKPSQVDQILWALSLWYTPVTDDWATGWYATFRDPRAVDETLALIRNTDLHMPKNYVFIPGLQRGHIAWEMWHHDGDPQQLIEKVEQDWNAKIADVNNLLFGQ